MGHGHRAYVTCHCLVPLPPPRPPPQILCFALVCVVVHALDSVFKGFSASYFAIGPLSTFVWISPLSYMRVLSHVFGHTSWQHLNGNMVNLILVCWLAWSICVCHGVLACVRGCLCCRGCCNWCAPGSAAAVAAAVVVLPLLPLLSLLPLSLLSLLLLLLLLLGLGWCCLPPPPHLPCP